MENVYNQFKKYIEELAECVAYKGYSKKEKIHFYTLAQGATEFAWRTLDAAGERELAQKTCDLWNFEMMPKMAKEIWG